MTFNIGDSVQLVKRRDELSPDFEFNGVYPIIDIINFDCGNRRYKIQNEFGRTCYPCAADIELIKPFYTSPFKIGDVVKINLEKFYKAYKEDCYLTNEIGIVVDGKNTHGFSPDVVCDFPTINIHVGPKSIWKVNLDAVEPYLKEGDKVKIIPERLFNGCSAIKKADSFPYGVVVINDVSNHGLIDWDADSLIEYNVSPTIKVNLDEWIWRINLNAIEPYNAKEDMFVLWQQGLERYEQIFNVLSDLKKGISSDGNSALNIPRCKFCFNQKLEDGCLNCPWKIINNGKRCGTLGSDWLILSDDINHALDVVNNIKDKIQNQIKKMQGEEGL